MAGALFQIHGHQMVQTPKQYISRSNPGRRSVSVYSRRPIKITNVLSQSQAQSSYWASVNVAIEAYLKKAIPIREPLSVFEPMHHLVFHAPPTHAPALCVAACELVGGSRDQAMAAAAAVRLMHAASCTHDHLLSTHEPDSRPTAHHVFNQNIKLLTGDGIVPFGFELLARSQNSSPSDPSDPDGANAGRILRVMIEIARATGSEGIVGGQYEEFLCNQPDGDQSGQIECAWKKREGELHACAGACGAILGGGREEEIEKLRRFGYYVGMIQGMVNGGGKNKGEMIGRMRHLALNELRELSNEGKIGTLAKLVELDFSMCSL